MDKVKYWLDLATEDIDVARLLLKNGKLLHFGFMCHLVIEKALKAIIASSDADVPKTHDLVKLAKLGNVYSNMSDTQKDFLEVLLPLNIEARYPSHKQSILGTLTKATCADTLKETEELLAWIEQQL